MVNAIQRICTMFDTQLASAKTAIHRTTVSAPLRWLLAKGMIGGRTCNWGEGYAFVDTEEMFYQTGYCIGYDPNSSIASHRVVPPVLFDTIYCGYVLNTLDARSAANVIEEVRSHLATDGIAYFAVRTDPVEGERYMDGIITKRGTFQMSYAPYTNSETYDWIYKTGHYAIFKVTK